MSFRYFRHTAQAWPVAGACNKDPFGPDNEGQFLATLDAADPACAHHQGILEELSAVEARAWVATSMDTGDPGPLDLE